MCCVGKVSSCTGTVLAKSVLELFKSRGNTGPHEMGESGWELELIEQCMCQCCAEGQVREGHDWGSKSINLIYSYGYVTCQPGNVR